MPTLEENRDHAEAVIEKINAVIEGRAGHDISQYYIGGRQITKMPIADLLKLKKYYQTELQRIKQQERVRAGKSAGRTIKTVFG